MTFGGAVGPRRRSRRSLAPRPRMSRRVAVRAVAAAAIAELTSSSASRIQRPPACRPGGRLPRHARRLQLGEPRPSPIHPAHALLPATPRAAPRAPRRTTPHPAACRSVIFTSAWLDLLDDVHGIARRRREVARRADLEAGVGHVDLAVRSRRDVVQQRRTGDGDITLRRPGLEVEYPGGEPTTTPRALAGRRDARERKRLPLDEAPEVVQRRPSCARDSFEPSAQRLDEETPAIRWRRTAFGPCSAESIHEILRGEVHKRQRSGQTWSAGFG